MPHTHPHRTARARATGPRAFRITREQHQPADYEQDLRDAGLVEGHDGIWYQPAGVGV
jgi:hypothetical protein